MGLFLFLTTVDLLYELIRQEIKSYMILLWFLPSHYRIDVSVDSVLRRRG